MVSIAPAMNTAAVSATSADGCTISAPGLRISSVPRKPITVADQRRSRTRSPRISAAPTVANSGAVKVNAVTSASGIRLKAVNRQSIADKPISERRACMPKRPVRRTPGPAASTHGSMKTRPIRLRQNATTNGCSSADN